MDFETFRGSVQHLTREESLTFVRSNGLQTVFPEINETSPTELLIYPGLWSSPKPTSGSASLSGSEL